MFSALDGVGIELNWKAENLFVRNFFIWLSMFGIGTGFCSLSLCGQTRPDLLMKTTSEKLSCSYSDVKDDGLYRVNDDAINAITITVPSTAKIIDRNSFRGTGTRLYFIIFESDDLVFKQDAFENKSFAFVRPKAKYFTTSRKVFWKLVKNVDPERVNMVTLDAEGNFFMMKDHGVTDESKIKKVYKRPKWLLVGLTTKGQNYPNARMFIPPETTDIMFCALTCLPKSVKEFVVNTDTEEIQTVEWKAFYGISKSTKITTNYEETAVAILWGEWEKTVEVNLVSEVSGKKVVNTYTAFPESEYILIKQKKQIRLLSLSFYGVRQTLVLYVPKKVTHIDSRSFVGCVAKMVDFSRISSENINIERNALIDVLEVKYYTVSDHLMRRKLILGGVDKNKIYLINKSSRLEFIRKHVLSGYIESAFDED